MGAGIQRVRQYKGEREREKLQWVGGGEGATGRTEGKK